MSSKPITGSTVPRRQLGRELRRLREEAGLPRDAVAEALEWSTPRIWRIEKGMVAMRAIDTRLMCELYRADQPTTEALMGLARETKAKGWWHAYGTTIPAHFDLYLGLEAAASRLRTYESELVPGLLQTADYARRVMAMDKPYWTAEETGQAVEVRMERQRILVRTVRAPNLEVMVSESVLWRADADQLTHIAEATHSANVTVRVVPLSVGIHPAATGSSFVILEFASNAGRLTEPTTVYCAEGPTGALYLDQPGEVEAYEKIWNETSEVSLDEADSRSLILRLAKEVGTDAVAY